jgi:hypothetical protein
MCEQIRISEGRLYPATLDARPNNAVLFSFIMLCFTSGESLMASLRSLIFRGWNRANTPFPAPTVLVYIAVQPESQNGNSGVIRIASSRQINNV